MPNGNETKPFQLPPFPTQYTEKDRERLEELEEQRRVMKDIYQQKFVPSAWEKTPLWERTFRAAAAILPSPSIMRGVIPWEEYQYGFTPEQAREYRLDVEEEYKELHRKERVTRKLADIQTDLLILALSEEYVTTTTTLLSQFPELRDDFTEEELSHIIGFAQNLVGASPEDILSGKVWQTLPGEEVISAVDLEEFLRKAGIDPRFILSSVAFSKDLGEIELALREAYPPDITKEEEIEGRDEFRQKLLDYFQRRNTELGITPEPGETVADVTRRAHEEIARVEGRTITVVDSETGASVDVQVREDNSAWFQGELIGAYDPETKKIVPYSFNLEPLRTEQEQESKLKDIWDALYAGAANMWYGTRQTMLTTLPDFLFTIEEKMIEVSPLSPETKKDMLRMTGNYRDTFRAGYVQRKAEYESWVVAHPELRPRPEWEGGVLDKIKEDPTILLDPAYIGYVAAETAAFTLSFLGTTLAVGFATGNPFVGLAAGVAVTTPAQTHDLYEDLLMSGATEDQASLLSVPIGAVISSVEVLGGLPFLKAVAPQFFTIFRRNVQREVAKRTLAAFAAKGLTTFTKIEIAETLEEVIQGAIQDATVKTVDENRDLLVGIPETVVRTLIATLPLAIIGGGAEYKNFKKSLPPDELADLNDATEQFKAAGLSQEQAELVAVGKMLETEKGREAVNKFAAGIEEKPAKRWFHGTSVEGKASIRKEGFRVSRPDVEVAMFGEGVYLAPDEAGAKAWGAEVLPVEITVKNPYIFDYNDKASRERTAKILGEDPDSDVEGWDLSDLATKLKDLGYDALQVKIAFSELTEEEREVADLPSVFGAENQLIVFDPKNIRIARKVPAKKRPVVVTKELGEIRTELTAVEEDITVFTSSYETAVGRAEGLEKAKAPEAVEAREKAVDLKVRLDELTKSRDELTSRLAELEKAPVREPALMTREEFLVNMPYRDTTYAGEIQKIEAEIATTEASRELIPTASAIISKLKREISAIKKKAEVARLAYKTEVPTAVEFVVPEEAPQGETILGKNKAAAITPTPSVHPTDFYGLPRLQDFDAVLADEKAALERHPEVARTIKPPADLDAAPDRSITLPFPLRKFETMVELFDSRYAFQFYEEATGQPFMELYDRIHLIKGVITQREQELISKRIGQDPRFNHIRGDDAALLRVDDITSSRNPALGVEMPEGATENEIALADVFEGIYKEYEPIARICKFEQSYGTLEEMVKSYPDVVALGIEAELEEAIRLYEVNPVVLTDEFMVYMAGRTWGLIDNGFSPWMTTRPTLTRRVVRIGTARGGARFMRRISVEFPEGMEKNNLQRLAAYIRQVESYWQLRLERQRLGDLCDKVEPKLKNPHLLFDLAEGYISEIEGFPERSSLIVRAMFRLRSQAMKTVFGTMPWLPFRNIHQHVAFHPDRTELLRMIGEYKSLPTDLRAFNKIYYALQVSQMQGIRVDWIQAGYKPITDVIPGLRILASPVNRLIDRLAVYAHSDNVPRHISDSASLLKAYRATTQYRKDGDIKKWVKNSGAIHLRRIEQDKVKTMLIREKVDLGAKGLREVPGEYAACIKVAHEVTNHVHFVYERAARAMVEWGTWGRLVLTLVTFQRQYVQRHYFNMQKLLSKESTFAERRAGIRDTMLLVIIGSLISEYMKEIWGKTRRSYNPIDIIQWEIGGLGIGVAEDLIVILNDLLRAFDPTSDQETKDRALARIPRGMTSLGDTLIYFYKLINDSLDAFYDTRNIDVHFWNLLRAKIDEEYTPEELEEIDRTTTEKFVKAFLGGDVADLDAFEQAQKDVAEVEGRLGEMDAEGRFYTLSSFGSDVRRITRPLPDDMLTEDYRWSPLVLYYLESQDLWDEYYNLPTTPAKIRQDYREVHVELEVCLLFWGKYSKSVFREGTPEARELVTTLRTLFDYYNIDKRMHSRWAEWGMPVITPAE